jgi:hypothetical protein
MSYRDRVVRDYNECSLLKHNFKAFDGATPDNGIMTLNLNNLSISGIGDTYFSNASSIVNTLSGVRKLTGTLGKKLTDDIGVSLKKVDYPTNKNNNIKVFNTVVFENFNDTQTVSQPISTSKDIYSINTYDEKLYIQSFDTNVTGDVTSKGTITQFSSDRQLLSTFNLNVSAASGCYLDFVNENNKIKLLSVSNGLDNSLIIDKIDLENGNIESTVTSFSSNQLILSASDVYMMPTGFDNVYDKYKDKQGDLHLKASFTTFERVELNVNKWGDNVIVYDNSASL